MGGAYTRKGVKRNAYRILVGKPEGKKPLGRPRRKWVNNTKMYLREIGWDGMDWIVMNLLIMQFSPTSRHYISLLSKYSPQHPVLKHPQSKFLP
jgi:hypothetical protein